MTTKLINEQAINESTVLNEEVNGQKHMYITGPFLQSTEKNRNGRIYSREIIEREVNKFQKLIESREAVGELSHPESGEISPDRAAILITDLKMDDKYAVGKAKVLSTPCGKILECLLNDGVRMGVSSRGTGSLGEGNMVCEDYNLITIDAVYMPSAQCAYTDAMYESVNKTTDWILNESTGLYTERNSGIIKMNEEFAKIEEEYRKKIAQAHEVFEAKVSKYGSVIVKKAMIDFIRSL